MDHEHSSEEHEETTRILLHLPPVHTRAIVVVEYAKLGKEGGVHPQSSSVSVQEPHEKQRKSEGKSNEDEYGHTVELIVCSTGARDIRKLANDLAEMTSINTADDDERMLC